MTLLAERPTRQVMTGPPHPDLHLVSELRLAALPTAVVCAQLFTKYTLQEWRLYELIEMAERLTTELVTNAVRTTGITDPNPRSLRGHIGLQNHHPGSKVQFRNIQIKPI